MKWKLKRKRNQGHGFLGCDNVSTSTHTHKERERERENKCAYLTTVYSTDIMSIMKQHIWFMIWIVNKIHGHTSSHVFNLNYMFCKQMCLQFENVKITYNSVRRNFWHISLKMYKISIQGTFIKTSFKICICGQGKTPQNVF